MEIDITSSDGNTLTALGIASKIMRAAGRNRAEIDALRKEVFSAESPYAARDAITKATFGSVTFYDPRDRDDGE